MIDYDALGREALISPEQVLALLGTPHLRIVDATYHLAATGRDAKAEYRERRIPGAVFFAIDAIADPTSTLPHMVPTKEAFAEAMARLGIGDDDFVVAYDTYGLFSAARAWWMLRLFGHERVAVLDGGLPAWLALGGSTVCGEPVSQLPARFSARRDDALVCDADGVAAALSSQSAQLIDARSVERFRGDVAESRPGVRSGHIPGSLNLPYGELLDPRGRMLSRASLGERFAAAGAALDRKTVASCGSGITACVLTLGLYRLGSTKTAVYDGSWSEWGGDARRPIVRERKDGECI